MTGYLLRRAAASLLLLWLVVTLTFLLIHATPGSPAQVLSGARGLGDPAQQQRLERLYGLDRPLHEQYLTWLGNAVHGDWGHSLVTGRPVARMVAEALPHTLLLALAATAVEYSLALPLGVWAARRRGALPDHLVRTGSLVLYSTPVFWLGLMAIIVFSYLWPVLPASGMRSTGAGALSALARTADLLHHLVLPATVLGLSIAGGTVRYVRNSLLDVLGQDYVRTARAKGLSERRVVGLHAGRNALVPILQILGVNLPALLNGSLVIEVVVGWPGLGRVTFQALGTRDIPVLLATTTLATALVVVGNLAADLAHAAADPRLRRG